jgi:hypothetical protein
MLEVGGALRFRLEAVLRDAVKRRDGDAAKVRSSGFAVIRSLRYAVIYSKR